MADDRLDAGLVAPLTEPLDLVACAVGFHIRGLCVKTWTALQPSSSARSIAFEMPPAEET